MEFTVKALFWFFRSLLIGIFVSFVLARIIGLMFPATTTYVFVATATLWAWIAIRAAIARARARALGLLDELGTRIWE